MHDTAACKAMGLNGSQARDSNSCRVRYRGEGLRGAHRQELHHTTTGLEVFSLHVQDVQRAAASMESLDEVDSIMFYAIVLHDESISDRDCCYRTSKTDLSVLVRRKTYAQCLSTLNRR